MCLRWGCLRVHAEVEVYDFLCRQEIIFFLGVQLFRGIPVSVHDLHEAGVEAVHPRTVGKLVDPFALAVGAYAPHVLNIIFCLNKG